MKKWYPYIITFLLVVCIFLIIFVSKGIFPFGNNSLIWGDMHDQITAFYYHFYDCFHGKTSLLVNFTTSSGINFIGILAYYILSPFSFILLLFPREQIYLAVSIVIALKILVSSLTCLYFIRTYFKKIPSGISVFLALIYAFSGYSLTMYQITPWIDVMYLFPLIVMGLKKVLDLEKPTMYIVFLSLALICSFYVSMMVLIFIFLASFIYLLVYKNSKERKKGILALGITTIISLMISLFIIVPSYLQISISSRVGFDLGSLLNSRTGPITDKFVMIMFGGVMYLGLLLLIRNFKKHKKFITWYFPTLLIMLVPLIIEPINKIWHFGSYAFFTYRAGFILMFLLIIGACYGFEYYKNSTNKTVISQKLISIIITVVSCLGIIFLTIKYYDDFQAALYTLTLSVNHMLLCMLAFTTGLAFIGSFLILTACRKIDKFSTVLMGIILLVHITCNSFLYLGIDSKQNYLMGQYRDLHQLEENYKSDDYYRVKNLNDNFLTNTGMIMKYHSLDHFTSLTDRSNIRSLKKLGYSSMWVKTSSRGGTLFTDALLANKYIMAKDKIKDNYYKYIKKYGSFGFYESKMPLSYGYFINDNSEIMDRDNSFEIQNYIYGTITGEKENLFTIYDDWKLNNIKKKIIDNKNSYHIIDEDAYNYFEKDVLITDKGRLYLEILGDIDNGNNMAIYQNFNIYINNKIFIKEAVEEYNNGVIDLGSFEDEIVNIKIELLTDSLLDNITLGVMDNNKYEKFLSNNQTNSKVDFHRNKINVEIESDKKQLLYLPIAYNTGYRATLNDKEVPVVKVFDNYIGIEVEKGINEIKLSFMPKGFIISTIISIVVLVFTVWFIKSKTYYKLLEIEFMQNIVYKIYSLGYIAFIFLIYIVLTICFILSYFITF